MSATYIKLGNVFEGMVDLRWGFWVRLFGAGFSIAEAPPLFSERAGHRRCFRVGGWRLKLLPRK